MELLEKARALKTSGRHADAVELFRQMIDAASGPNIIAEALPSYQKVDAAEAERLTRQALAQLPDHPLLKHHLGEALARQGRGSEAIPLFRAAVAVSPVLAELQGGGAKSWTIQDPTVPCPACGQTEGKPIWVGNASGIQKHLGLIDPVKVWLRCDGCGLVRVPNPAPAERLDAWYQQTYSAGETHNPPTGSQLHQILGQYEDLLGRVQRHRNERGGRLLELGASWGLLMATARWQGYEVEGLELASKASSWGRERLGLDLKQGRVPEDLPTGSWDVIVMLEVIEHLTHPDTVLQTLRSRLRRGGQLVLSTPLLDHPYHQVTGYDDPMWGVPGHLIYYDRRTLQDALERAGMRLVEWWSSPRHLGSGMVLATAA